MELDKAILSYIKMPFWRHGGLIPLQPSGEVSRSTALDRVQLYMGQNSQLGLSLFERHPQKGESIILKFEMLNGHH